MAAGPGARAGLREPQSPPALGTFTGQHQGLQPSCHSCSRWAGPCATWMPGMEALRMVMGLGRHSGRPSPSLVMPGGFQMSCSSEGRERTPGNP